MPLSNNFRVMRIYVQGNQYSDRAKVTQRFLNTDSVRGTVSRQERPHLGHESNGHPREPLRQSEAQPPQEAQQGHRGYSCSPSLPWHQTGPGPAINMDKMEIQAIPSSPLLQS